MEQRLEGERHTRAIDAGSELPMVVSSPTELEFDADRPYWLIPGDFAHALIHLAWLIVKGQRYLVFGLVELYPTELQEPDETTEAPWQYRDLGGSHRICVKRHRLTVDVALSWYNRCRAGKVVLPGDAQADGSPKLLGAAGWSAEPPWLDLIAAKDLPFVTRTWGTATY